MNASTVLTLLLSTAAVGWGAWNERQRRELHSRLRALRSSHGRQIDALREELYDLQENVRRQEQALRLSRGEPLFTPSTTVQEAIEIDPRAAEVLAGFHIGGCDGCAVDPGDSLKRAATASNQPMDPLLKALNGLADGPAAGEVTSERRPNVRLDL